MGRWIVLGFALVGAVAVLLGLRFAWTGVSARPGPSTLETRVARTIRHYLIPGEARERANPLLASPELLAEAERHFLDHCAECHGEDGRGDTEIGRGLHPRAPDLTLAATQSLPDGELFWIIENGVRLTGMPAFGDVSSDDDEHTWSLVHWIRGLPEIPHETSASEPADGEAAADHVHPRH